MIGLSDPRSTIVAIATSTTPSLRGAVRIAGGDAVKILQAVATTPIPTNDRPFFVSLTIQLAAPLGEIPAQALVWPTTSSYTGSPSVEIHTYGSLPILEAIVECAVRQGARPAGPGEFTMRAFLAGRLDLTQAEAVLGVIDATSRPQLDAALTQLAGNVSAPLRSVRENLLNLLADLEAGLDFVEEDISFIDDQTLRGGLAVALDSLEAVMAKLRSHRRSESFDWVVLRGQPNAGKSSLLNALSRESVAIVSDQSGTTRDVVWKELLVQGHALRIADTAGIESGDDRIVQESQRAAEDIQLAASVTILCCDATRLMSLSDSMSDVEAEFHQGVPNTVMDTSVIRVATKCDLIAPLDAEQLKQRGWVVVSTSNEQSLEELLSQIVESISLQHQSDENGVVATAARCADAMERAVQALNCAVNLLDLQTGHELVAAEIRQTLGAVGEMTGEIYTDDILDRVFSRFCIGK
jgi:tRNA modification GTPase